MRIIMENPLSAETPIGSLHTWISDNKVFFKRNQRLFSKRPVDLDIWSLSIDGLVKKPLTFP